MSNSSGWNITGPKVFDTFGFGVVILLYVLWRNGAPFGFAQSFEQGGESALLEQFSLLVSSFLLFLAYAIGQFAKTFGASIWYVCHGTVSVNERIQGLCQASVRSKERVWNLYLELEKKADYQFTLLGCSALIFLGEVLTLFGGEGAKHNEFLIVVSLSLLLMALVRARSLKRDIKLVLAFDQVPQPERLENDSSYEAPKASLSAE